MLFKHTTNVGLSTNREDQSYVGEHFLADCLYCVLLILRVLRYVFGSRLWGMYDVDSIFYILLVFLLTGQLLGVVYAEKTTSELKKDRTFPTLFLAKTLILRLAVVRASLVY